MGITPWVLRMDPLQQGLSQLAQTVASCTRCPLHQSRTQTVFARGNTQASLMIVGEAPGFHEDQQGEPFVGKAGLLLNKMLQCIGFTADDVYIANVLKCRPPNNRDPQRSEIDQCVPYLAQQIELTKPRVIMAVGRFAAQYLLNSTLSLGQLRSKKHQYQGTEVIVSYHPAYLLRNPKDKKKAYQDLLWLKEQLKES